MSTYEYTLIDLENSIYRGRMRGWSKRYVSKHLNAKGYSIVTLNRVRTKFDFWHKMFRHISRIDKIILLRNLMTMMKAGLNLPEALASSREQTTNPNMRRIINDAERAVLSGQPLSSVLAKYSKVFSPVTVAMIRIGEQGGRLVDTLEYLVKQQENDYSLLRKIRNALVYPTLIFVTMILMVILMMIVAIPKIAIIYEEASAPLPFFTGLLIGISNFIVSYGLVLALSLVALGILVRTIYNASPKMQEFFHKLLLKLPMVGLVIKKINLAMISRSLNMLTASGFSIDEGLVLSSHVANNLIYRKSIQSAVNFVKRGVKLSVIFKGDPNIYLPLFHKMVVTGEDTGCLDDMFSHISKYYDDDIQHWTTNISTLIEPLLLLITGVVVGGVAFAVIFPLWNFANII